MCEQLFRAFEKGLIAVEAPKRRGRRRGRSKTARGSTTVAHLVQAAQTMVDEGQHDEAAALLRSALALDPFRADARALMKTRRASGSSRRLYAQLPAHVGAAHRARRRPRCRCRRGAARAEHVNGRWDVGALALTTGVGELETLRALRRLVHVGRSSTS